MPTKQIEIVPMIHAATDVLKFTHIMFLKGKKSMKRHPHVIVSQNPRCDVVNYIVDYMINNQ